jgi:hypothetical protein
VGSSLNQRTAEFSLCNTLALLLDLSFKQYARDKDANEANAFSQLLNKDTSTNVVRSPAQRSCPHVVVPRSRQMGIFPLGSE